MVQLSHDCQPALHNPQAKNHPAFLSGGYDGVVHNAEYFRWFEEGRLQIMTDIISIDCVSQHGYAFPVIENTCRYLGLPDSVTASL